ncbi:MAG: hypothetical protein LUG16_07670 [Candidatus Gastranaerophilales bacterium]|nr:hypothetical protein [Candidatus Gastranaerophilales bacterium]
MKKFYLLVLSFICLSTTLVFADSPCNSEQGYYNRQSCTKPCKKPCNEPCKKQNPCAIPDSCQRPCNSQCFLCTNKDINSVFSQINLSETQICTACKIQEKYELETLSINEKIQCEQEKLGQLNSGCSTWSERHKQKKLVNRLKKDRKKICKCYEDQFKTILSNDQIKAYKKAIK